MLLIPATQSWSQFEPGNWITAKFIIDLTRYSSSALFLMIIVHHQTGVDDARDPSQQGEDNTQKKTAHPTGQQNRERRQHHTEKISQRFHVFLFLTSDR